MSNSSDSASDRSSDRASGAGSSQASASSSAVAGSTVVTKKYQTLLVEIRDRVATVSMNRPDVRNAFHPDMIRELTQSFEVLSADPTVAVVVLRGEGKSFCSGADLGYRKSMSQFSLEQKQSDSKQLYGMFWAIRSCPHPIIGRLHGHVMGGALGLASLCDISAAVDGTKFCFSEVKLGLAPAVISPFVLEKMTASYARRYMLTGEIFEVAEAKASGLVQHNGDEADVDQFIQELLHGMLNNGAQAVRATKKLLRQVEERTAWVERRELTTQLIAELRVGAEGQEGLKAFFEKRAPNWK